MKIDNRTRFSAAEHVLSHVVEKSSSHPPISDDWLEMQSLQKICSFVPLFRGDKHVNVIKLAILSPAKDLFAKDSAFEKNYLYVCSRKRFAQRNNLSGFSQHAECVAALEVRQLVFDGGGKANGLSKLIRCLIQSWPNTMKVSEPPDLVPVERCAAV